jgi:pimeloyl-ACP methyl ester carboxylesterase
MPASNPAVPPVRSALAHSWTGADRGGVTVVLHGGGPGCHAQSDFAAVLALRPERRWLCVDLPGYGASRALSAGEASRPRLTVLAQALAGQLQRLGMTTVDILAQSLGGAVALRLALEQPRTIRRIVLIGSQPASAPGGVTSLTADPGVGPRARAAYYGGSGPSPDKMRRLIADLEWYDGARVPDATVLARYRASTTPAALAGAAAGVPEDIGELLGAVRAPTLIIWGRHDPFAGPDYASALASALSSGDLVVLGRAAHHPQAERPAAVAALVDAFLDGCE